MARKRKVRYQRDEKPRVEIRFSGRIFLQHRDVEALESPAKGDFLLFPNVEALNTIRQGEYWSTGYAGYFKVDVYDGRTWQPVILNELFPGREHHFTKTECPIDTFELCQEHLLGMGDIVLMRKYREHYEVVTAEDESEDEA